MGEGKIGEGAVKIVARGGGAALAMVAVIELVEVAEEDVIFVPTAFDLAREKGFCDLGERSARTRFARDFDELLRDGGSARGDALVTLVLVKSA